MSSACPHRTPSRTARSVRGAMARGEAMVIAQGGTWTAPRRRVYELLLRADRPRKAYDLIASYNPHKPTTAPPTVYRALDFLTAAGLVHKVESESAFVVCDNPSPLRSPQFAICECCGHTEEISIDSRKLLGGVAQRSGYLVNRVVVETRGLCANCR